MSKRQNDTPEKKQAPSQDSIPIGFGQVLMQGFYSVVKRASVFFSNPTEEPEDVEKDSDWNKPVRKSVYYSTPIDLPSAPVTYAPPTELTEEQKKAKREKFATVNRRVLLRRKYIESSDRESYDSWSNSQDFDNLASKRTSLKHFSSKFTSEDLQAALEDLEKFGEPEPSIVRTFFNKTVKGAFNTIKWLGGKKVAVKTNIDLTEEKNTSKDYLHQTIESKNNNLRIEEGNEEFDLNSINGPGSHGKEKKRGALTKSIFINPKDENVENTDKASAPTSPRENLTNKSIRSLPAIPKNKKPFDVSAAASVKKDSSNPTATKGVQSKNVRVTKTSTRGQEVRKTLVEASKVRKSQYLNSNKKALAVVSSILSFTLLTVAYVYFGNKYKKDPLKVISLFNKTKEYLFKNANIQGKTQVTVTKGNLPQVVHRANPNLPTNKPIVVNAQIKKA
ncbi:MAG: hypothetical protein J0H68_04225 [Sphingobacteriia bacterium]|nr:hypothetical protein [Sphingobacteriia bacterium]